jgi:hypothetical protein
MALQADDAVRLIELADTLAKQTQAMDSAVAWDTIHSKLKTECPPRLAHTVQQAAWARRKELRAAAKEKRRGPR